MSVTSAPDDDRPRRVCVAGATGYIGRHVVAELAARGHEVIALVRPASADSANGDALLAPARRCLVDVSDAEAITGLFGRERPDAVISCLAARDGAPGPAWAIDDRANQLLLNSAEACGAHHFVLLSALCVQTPRLAFQQAKRAFERRLQESTLNWSIVRPSAFFKSLAGQIERVRRGKPFLLFGSGDGPACLPISEADLAVFLADCLEQPERWQQILPIGGPGPAVTPVDRARMLFALAGRPPRYRRLPLSALRIADRTLSGLARLWPRAGNGAEFARIAYFYATEPMLAIDPASGQASAKATPRAGHTTLATFYEQAWQRPSADQALGAQALFDRRRPDQRR